jgi:hypothetical protein
MVKGAIDAPSDRALGEPQRSNRTGTHGMRQPRADCHASGWSGGNGKMSLCFDAVVDRQVPTDHEEAGMLDFLMIVYGVGFFGIAILYGLACEKM